MIGDDVPASTTPEGGLPPLEGLIWSVRCPAPLSLLHTTRSTLLERTACLITLSKAGELSPSERAPSLAVVVVVVPIADSPPHRYPRDSIKGELKKFTYEPKKWDETDVDSECTPRRLQLRTQPANLVGFHLQSRSYANCRSNLHRVLKLTRPPFPFPGDYRCTQVSQRFPPPPPSPTLVPIRPHTDPALPCEQVSAPAISTPSPEVGERSTTLR